MSVPGRPGKPGAVSPESIEEIARQFGQAEAQRLLPRGDGAVDELLFDGEIDGKRYVLVRSAPARNLPGLSPREHEIARLVAQGLPNKAIAAVLDISLWTVSTHLRRVYAKLGVSCRAAMVSRLSEPTETVREARPQTRAAG